MNKAFQGKDEKGIYHQFEWDTDDGEPTESETGLTDIEEITL